MTTVAQHALPGWLRGYRREWASRDIVAGVTLAAVAIPEMHGLHVDRADARSSTGLYTVIFPTIVFALLGSSKLLVVGRRLGDRGDPGRRAGRGSASPG